MRRILRKGAQIFALCSLAVVLIYLILPRLLPWEEGLIQKEYEESYRIYSREGELLREAVNSQGVFARWSEREEIPEVIIEAVLAAEDENYYRHGGVDVTAVLRALWQNITRKEVFSGASTLSMQLARMVKKHPRTLWGKASQIFTALRLEAGLDKEEILTAYLNMVPLGGGNLGAESGARHYFQTPLALLTPSQAAFLAGVIQGPGLYNPEKNFEGALARRNYVLRRMTETGYLTEGQRERALKEPLQFRFIKETPKAMHFTDFVLKKAGEGNLRGGDIQTTLNLSLQKSAENLVSDHIQKLKGEGIHHGALLAVDNSTGEILIMVGSPDYWDPKGGSNNGTTMLRQPGSTLKPFTYTAAFSRGWSPASVIPDIPISYTGGDKRLYMPENYSGTFLGPVTLKAALGRSLNIPAVRLANDVGIDYLLEKLLLFGFDSLEKGIEHYGLGLTLGNGEVSLYELVRAYSVFARKGEFRELKYLKNQENPGEKILHEDLSYLITDILSSENLRMRAFGVNNPLLVEFPLSVKTGTSNNWKDNWVIGYTREFTLGIWTGNFSGEPTNQLSGASGAGPLFQQALRLIHYSLKGSSLPLWEEIPENILSVTVCPLSGMIPSEACPRSEDIRVLKTTRPQKKCTVHKALEVDVRNGFLATEAVSPEHRVRVVYEYLGPEYSSWQAARGVLPPPVKFSPYRDVEQRFQILHPHMGDRFIFEPGYNKETQSVELKASVKDRGEKLYWFINGEIYKEALWPWSASFPVKPGDYTLTIGSEKERSEEVVFSIR